MHGEITTMNVPPQYSFHFGGHTLNFVGTLSNDLLSQLWIALIAYLLLSYLKFKSRFKWSVYTLCAVLPTNLFSRRNLWDWLNDPFKQSAKKPPDLQLKFAFG